MEKRKQGRPVVKGFRDPPRSIRVPDEEWEAWKKTAEAKGLSLTMWLRTLANQAAKRANRTG